MPDIEEGEIWMDAPADADYSSDHPDGNCKVCGKPIKIAIFKGGLWCSEKHRKIYRGEKKAGLR